SVDADERVAGIETATIFVQLRDASGNAVSKAGINVKFATTLGKLDGENSPVTVQTDANGQASVTLSSASAGEADVTAEVDVDGEGDFQGVTNGGDEGTITVTFIAGDAAQIALSGPNTTVAGAIAGPFTLEVL